MSELERLAPVYGLSCHGCGCALELPADLTTFQINCPSCGTDNVLAPLLIQARQRQYDLQLLAAERTRQVEQQRLMQERVLAARRATSRRTTVMVWIVVGVLLVLPALVLGTLFVLGAVLGKKAIHSLQAVQDPDKNGLRTVMKELENKRVEGCQLMVTEPQSHIGRAGAFRFQVPNNQSCVHLLAATSVASADLGLEQSSHHSLKVKLPAPAQALDYRLCADAGEDYEFLVQADKNTPFSIAAIACPRTVAEGLVRSVAGDPVTTCLAALRGWVDEFRALGCRQTTTEPAAQQGPQVLDIESTEGGPCFNLLVASHFADVRLTVKLTSPGGQLMASPEPATRVHLEYCPNQTGRHQVEVVPSTRDHYAMATLDCPRASRNASAPKPGGPLRIR